MTRKTHMLAAALFACIVAVAAFAQSARRSGVKKLLADDFNGLGRHSDGVPSSAGRVACRLQGLASCSSSS